MSKADAAERQFKSAVRLFFQQNDLVSAHTLTCASCQVLSDLLSAAGAGGLFRNRALIHEHQWKEWRERVKGEENFLKHADKDPTGSLTLDSAITALFLVEASILLESVAQRVLVETRVMLVWAMHAWPEMFRLSDEKQALVRPERAADYETWAAMLDNPDGLLDPMLAACEPPPFPTSPYDLSLRNAKDSGTSMGDGSDKNG